MKFPNRSRDSLYIIVNFAVHEAQQLDIKLSTSELLAPVKSPLLRGIVIPAVQLHADSRLPKKEVQSPTSPHHPFALELAMEIAVVVAEQCILEHTFSASV